MRYVIIVISLLLIGSGCVSLESSILEQVDRETVDTVTSSQATKADESEEINIQMALPVNGRLTYKGFGEYFQDRFSGYHVAIDLEAPADTPVYAIADGEVTYAGSVSGYGGVMVIKHMWNEETISAIYGHLDPGSLLSVGSKVLEADQIGVLGAEGTETDGEREHIHFAMYEGSEVRLNGYELNASAVANWLNPVDELGVAFSSGALSATDRQYAQGETVFALDFVLPDGWDVEYVPSIESLNLYTLSGEGTARERSQIFIRYFDASSFLTLSTVEIYSTKDLVVGVHDYIARQYDIEKKPGVANFVDQPSWRNERHIVTDFKDADGYTRYYVVAKNPALDESIYQDVLSSMEIKK